MGTSQNYLRDHRGVEIRLKMLIYNPETPLFSLFALGAVAVSHW